MRCVVCGRERDDLIDDQCADCTMDDFRQSLGLPRQFSPVGQGDILASIVDQDSQQPPLCPSCGQPELHWNAGDWESSTDSQEQREVNWECEECGYHWHETEVRDIEEQS